MVRLRRIRLCGNHIGRGVLRYSDPTAALLAVFATFAVAFFARPLGGLFFGSLADRIGRQRCLATVVVLMSLSTFAIGVLPGYATIGVAAPVLLLLARILQGFSAGGEIAGAAAFVNEYAPRNRRGVLSSLLPAASATGLLFGAVLLTILTSNLSEEAMNTWGWRVPFLIALPLGAIGLYLRLKIEDTPMFRPWFPRPRPIPPRCARVSASSSNGSRSRSGRHSPTASVSTR